MSKKKKLLIGIGIYLVMCGIIYFAIYTTRTNPINEFCLERFRKSEVLREKFGEITKVKISFIKSLKTVRYDEDKYIKEYIIYTSDGSKHNLQLVYYIEGTEFFAYLIDGELVYENDELND